MLQDPKISAKLAVYELIYDKLRFTSICELDMEMAETATHFRAVPSESDGLEWRGVRPGDKWGDNWRTAWLRGVVTVPEELEGKQLFLRAQTGAPEAMLLIDGKHRGVFDDNHPVRLLALNAVAGAHYDIDLEAYAGHSFPGTQPFEELGQIKDPQTVVTPLCRTFQKVELVLERADVTAFVLELRALRQLTILLDEHSLRRGRIQAALEKVFALVVAKPAETDESLWRTAIGRARDTMRPLLEQKNGPSTPQLGISGHSHIDTAWLWPLDETWRKLARTFSSVLSLMDQYPEFRFISSAALHADVVRRLYPEIFEQMRARVEEGRWEINGAMWIEPDCNIPSGESLVRQCLIGQQATREMFGVTSDTLWLPDVFGYSAALPQILHGCGVEFFCTTKLSWNDTNRFPYDTFTWQGIDGSTVLAHFNRIHCWPDPETLASSWNGVQHKDVQDRMLVNFGYGDGGGGPQAEMIEMARICRDLEGCPKAEYTTVTEFMAGCRDDLERLPRWVGELYLELHRGTLTSVAPIKRYNRKCEFGLRDAEFAATLARLQTGMQYPAGRLLDAWKKLLLNQFHDILPGSSIARVNDEAVEAFAACLAESIAVRDAALDAIASPAISVPEYVLLSSSLSWARSGEIEITGVPDGCRPAGNGVVAQLIKDVEGQSKLSVTGLTLPSAGYIVVPLIENADAPASPFHWDGATLVTPFARVGFDTAGRIVSFFDRTARRELVSEGGAFNNLLLGEDVPAAWDNWDIDRDQRLKLAPQEGLLSRDIVADGPLQMRIRQEYRIGRASTLTQDLVFHAASAQVDFETVVDWREKHQFLKVGFNVNVLADSARHEIQFGHVTRSTHDNTSYDRAQFDVCAHKWTDMSETGYGVAFLNDCKYACTIKGGEYRLSLLKSGCHPDARGDEGRHRFTYSLLPHQSGFSVESVVRPAYELNCPPVAADVQATGEARFSLVEVNSPNIIVESVKWAENGDGFILRLYEAGKTGVHAVLSFGAPIASVEETNLLEEAPIPLTMAGNTAQIYFKPFEIKTLRCRP